MITAMCVNPCVDKIYYINNFELAKMYRSPDVLMSAGGKGVNVARVAALMGEKVRCLGFRAGYPGAWLEEQINSIGIEPIFTEAEGETRTNTNIIDKEKKTETEILESGPIIRQVDIDSFIKDLNRCLEDTQILICSGSLALGMSDRFYAEVIMKAKRRGIKVLLDTSGQPLLKSIHTGPYMVKPNIRELSVFSSNELSSDDSIIAACKRMIREGVEIVIASMGRRGALLVSCQLILRAEVPEINVVNTIGCGDSAVAGFAVGLKRGRNIEECFRLSMACALANTQYEGIGCVEDNLIKYYSSKIHIKEINVGGK